MERRPNVPYPALPLPERSRYGVLSSVLWGATTVTVHLLVYAAARSASEPRVAYAEPLKELRSNHVIIVRDLHPEAPPAEIPSRADPPEQTDDAARLPRPKKTAPTKPRRPSTPTRHAARVRAAVPPRSAKDAPVFRDIGVMGSLDIGATGPGGSFAVAVGNSGVGGPIGRHGRIEGVASPNAPRTAAPLAPPPLPRAVSIRNLSRKAIPKTRYNRGLKAPYPKQLREKAVSGEVQAMLLVLADGTVGRVDILRSADEAFAASAIRVFKRFLFEPALDKDGKPVTSKVRLTYRFLLE